MTMRLAAVLAVAVLPAAGARAQTFEDLRKAATDASDLGRALQPYLQVCAEPEEFQRRQCELLRDRLMTLTAAKTFRVPVASGAARVETGKAGKTELVVRGCVACERPVALPEGVVGGGFVTGVAPKSAALRADDPSRVELAGIDLARKPLAADAQVDPALLRAELIFRPRAKGQWQVAAGPGRVEARGTAVEILGYRVHDRCTGTVLVASPASVEAPPAEEKTDPTCPGYVAPVVKKEENLPKTLSPEQVKRSLGNLAEDILVCYEKFGDAGHAPTKLVVAGETGRIASIQVGGKFAGTPTAACIEKVVRQASFPRFRDAELKLEWPFYLR